jgi:HEAT repeat protein
VEVRFNCQCGKRLKVSAHAAGKTVKCPYCSRVIALPAATEVEASSSREEYDLNPASLSSPAPVDETTRIRASRKKPRRVNSASALDLKRIGSRLATIVALGLVVVVIGVIVRTLVQQAREAAYRAHVHQLFKDVKGRDAARRNTAMEDLKKLGAKVIPSAMETLSDPEAGEGADAFLRSLGREAAYAAPALVEALDDEIPGRRVLASTVLLQIGMVREDLIPTLINVLDHDADETVRVNVIQLINTAKPKVDIGLPVFGRAMRDRNALVRRAAIEAIAEYGEPAKSAVPSLVESLQRDEDQAVRAAAVTALMRFGPDAKAAVPDLIEMIMNPKGDPQTTTKILAAIGRDAAPAVPALLEMLKGTHSGSAFHGANLSQDSTIPRESHAQSAVRKSQENISLAIELVRAIARIGPDTPGVAEVWDKTRKWARSQIDALSKEGVLSEYIHTTRRDSGTGKITEQSTRRNPYWTTFELLRSLEEIVADAQSNT